MVQLSSEICKAEVKTVVTMVPNSNGRNLIVEKIRRWGGIDSGCPARSVLSIFYTTPSRGYDWISLRRSLHGCPWRSRMSYRK